jgi:hypothetical protein
MPPLPVAGTLRSKRWLGHFIGVSVPREPKGKRIVDGLVPLSDKAICEYQDCRASMLLFLRQGNPDDLHRAQDHFESCIQALHRGINFLERLRSLGYVQSNGMPLVAKPRDLEVLRDLVRSKIRTFRDFIEHIEEDIIAQAIPLERPVDVHLGWERATINDATIEYKDLVRWCTQLHQMALPLSVVTATVGPPPDDSQDSRDA